MNISVLSQRLAEKYAQDIQSPQTLLISISSHGEREAQITPNENNRIKEVLFLHFDDVDNTTTGIQPGDAVKIREFLETNVPRYAIHNIIVNCEAGQSRSAGIAAALMAYFNGDDTPIFDRAYYKPNMRCYRTVLNEMMYNSNLKEP